MNIQFLDLAAQNREIQPMLSRWLDELHERTAYIGGPSVAAFEADFANYLGVRSVVGVGSGTDALRLALLAMNIGPDDEVITSPLTFIATAEAIVQTGARPVFVDTDMRTGNISPDAVRRYLEQGRFRTKNGPRVILPVHLYGAPAQMPQLCEIAQQFGLSIVEDACQAHGARCRIENGWVKAGSIGKVGCFSFYPGKNLGAWGDGGAVATNDEEIAARIAMLRDHGRISHYAHQALGYNARLDAIQAAVVRAKLTRLEDWNQRRREIAEHYCRLLSDTEVICPSMSEGADSCYHLFVIRSSKRDRIRDALDAAAIGCGIHYPVPLHLQPACRELGHHSGDFPNSEQWADTVLSLPMHPHLLDREIAAVAEVVRKAVD